MYAIRALVVRRRTEVADGVYLRSLEIVELLALVWKAEPDSDSEHSSVKIR